MPVKHPPPPRLTPANIGRALSKSPTGITGLDEITEGGLPKGRPTLICGSAGCGKTLMSMEFLVRGATEFGEPGVYFAFEETPEELTQNVRSLGFDLERLERAKKLHLEYVHVDPSELLETGDYDLEGLFIRLGSAIDSIGAKRVVLDTLETLFGGFTNQALLRGELRRLFRWLKDRGVTAIITGERGDGSLTRQGLEEYVSDCVILLDHRIVDQVSTRRLRIVKYRGTTHGTNEYPFLIDERGIDVLPITSLGLDHTASNARVSTGVSELDEMLGGGVYRGSTVLLSGTAGSGKSSLTAHFAKASAVAGERCLVLAFEESPAQIARNMRSIGIDLNRFVRSGLLKIVAARPVLHGLESHLAVIHKHVREFKPQLVVIDPISDLTAVGSAKDAKAMMTRLVDFFKANLITTVLTNLTGAGSSLEQTEMGISSMVDTWLLLRDVEHGGERNRAMYILKSRGMAHSNQIREFLMTRRGIELRPAYIGPSGVLTGSARVTQENRDRAEQVARRRESDRRRRSLDLQRRALEAKMLELKAEHDQTLQEARDSERLELQDLDRVEQDRESMRRSRGVARPPTRAAPGGRNGTRS